jgi:hypothetical protein
MSEPLTPEQHAARMSERLALATDIADEAAASDIESYGVPHTVAGATWYFIGIRPQQDGYEEMTLARAKRYLILRERLEQHATQPHLVRIVAE